MSGKTDPNSTVRLLTSQRHILNAAKNLRDLDERQVDAVSARIDLDLRTGYAFTRFLTNSLRAMGGPLQQATISYGTFIVWFGVVWRMG